MTIREALDYGISMLSKISEGNLEARMLLEFVLNCDYNHILVHGDEIVTDEQIKLYNEYIASRCKNKPISQIMGLHGFYGLVLKVNEHTLIPRQETEVLVEYILNQLTHKVQLICDVGTGSGCIPIAICHENQNVKAIALDISAKALEVAKYNIAMHEMDERITCIESDLFSGFDESYNNTIDILISNPPYIPTDVIEGLDIQVKEFEPISALDGGTDGLDFYRKISSESLPFLHEGSLIIYEVGHDQSEVVGEILENNGFRDIGVIRDLSGVNRIVYGVLSKAEN